MKSYMKTKNNRKTPVYRWLWLLLAGFALAAQASDVLREKRLADEIVDAILDGEPVWLNDGERDFLGIYTEADEARGGVIVLHGRGFHPDWSDTVNPLRVGLAERGWNTLSLQMPVLGKEAKYFDYVPILHEAFPRIEAGIDYLKQQGNNKIILIAHSCSFHMVNAWIKAGRLRDIDAFVGIGMGATDYQQKMVDAFQLDKLNMPVLDIYGADDYPAVQRMAAERLQAIQHNSKSKQVVVPDANHYFTDQGEALVEQVASWLESL